MTQTLPRELVNYILYEYKNYSLCLTKLMDVKFRWVSEATFTRARVDTYPGSTRDVRIKAEHIPVLFRSMKL